MKKIYFFSTSQIQLDWTDTFTNFKNLNPDEVFILSNTEVYLEEIWGSLFELLQPWLEEHNKVATIITPHLDNVYVRKNIRSEQSFAMIESVIPLYKNKIYDTLAANKIFSAYMLRASESRGRLLDTLIKNNLLDDGYVTYHQPQTKVYEKFKYWNQPPIVFEEEKYSKDNVANFTDPLFYRKSFIDIVTETSYENHNFFMTEKTIRPICHEKPFVAIGPANFHTKYLKEHFGLELYDEIIDYSFDKEDCLQCRINDVVENIKNLVSQKNTLNKSYKKILPKLKYNRHVLETIYKDVNRIIPKSMHHLLDSKFSYEKLGFYNTSLVHLLDKFKKNIG